MTGATPAWTAPLVSMLMHVEEFPAGCHGRGLAGRTGLDPSTVSRAVASLVGLRPAERRADPADGRAGVLALTDAGRTALAAPSTGTAQPSAGRSPAERRAR